MFQRTFLLILLSCGLAVAAQAQTAPTATRSNAPTASPAAMRYSTSNPSIATPLFAVDGLLVSEEQTHNLNPADIESINVLKSEQATALYGSGGQRGVLIIKTKNAGKQQVRHKSTPEKLLVRPDEIHRN